VSPSTTERREPTEPPSDRVRLRRKRERGSYDRDVIDAILDEALIAHLGIVEPDGQPVVTPTLHARHGDVLYCHGAVSSRTLKALAAGTQACVTVSLLDGLVLARAAMHHSANYRSVMVMGTATLLEDADEKLGALEAVVEHIVPGRWPHVRPPSENELKATAVLALPIEQASAGAPEPDPRLHATVEIPLHASAYARPGAPRPRR
jgi:uncharacterized protein